MVARCVPREHLPWEDFQLGPRRAARSFLWFYLIEQTSIFEPYVTNLNFSVKKNILIKDLIPGNSAIAVVKRQKAGEGGRMGGRETDEGHLRYPPLAPKIERG